MVCQQYQRLEGGGNPRLDTLELAADGLNAKLMLIPIEKWHAVQALLKGETDEATRLDADHRLALNLNGKKGCYRLDEVDFRRWVEATDVA